MLSFHNNLYNITGFLYYTKSDGVCGLVNLTPERSDTRLIAMRRGLRRGIPIVKLKIRQQTASGLRSYNNYPRKYTAPAIVCWGTMPYACPPYNPSVTLAYRSYSVCESHLYQHWTRIALNLESCVFVTSFIRENKSLQDWARSMELEPATQSNRRVFETGLWPFSFHTENYKNIIFPRSLPLRPQLSGLGRVTAYLIIYTNLFI